MILRFAIILLFTLLSVSCISFVVLSLHIKLVEFSLRKGKIIKPIIFIISFLLSVWFTYFYIVNEENYYIFGLFSAVCFVLYFAWHGTKYGKRYLNYLPIEDDSSGNSNIEKEPWDYM